MRVKKSIPFQTSEPLPEWFRWALDRPGEPRFVDFAGARLHYLGWGLSNVSKPALLLVHGFRSHARWWDWIAPYLAEDFRVVAIDLTGMGDSGHRAEYTPETYIDDMIGVLDAASLGPVIGIGHSYGGSTMTRACVKRPDLFSRLVLVDCCLMFEDEAVSNHLPSRIIRDRSYPDQATAMSHFSLLPSQPVVLPFLAEHIARHSVRSTDQGWKWKFDLSIKAFDRFKFDATRLLASVEQPLDFIRGECSAVVTRERMSRMAAAQPRMRGPVNLPEAYHHCMLDQPLPLIATLRALLARGTPQVFPA